MGGGVDSAAGAGFWRCALRRRVCWRVRRRLGRLRHGVVSVEDRVVVEVFVDALGHNQGACHGASSAEHLVPLRLPRIDPLGRALCCRSYIAHESTSHPFLDLQRLTVLTNTPRLLQQSITSSQVLQLSSDNINGTPPTQQTAYTSFTRTGRSSILTSTPFSLSMLPTSSVICASTTSLGGVGSR